MLFSNHLIGTDKPAQLVNLSTGEIIATLSAAQVQVLKEHLDQGSPTDTNFSVTPEMIGDLQGEGAIELASILAGALGDAQEVHVGYAPISGIGSAIVRGRLLSLENLTPLIGYKIEIYDEDIAFDDLLGWFYADSQGGFEFRFDEFAFKPSSIIDLEGEPEVKLRIFDVDGKELGPVGILRGRQVDFGDIFVSKTGERIAPALDPLANGICPACGALYKSGSLSCSDCQVPIRRLDQVPFAIMKEVTKDDRRDVDAAKHLSKTEGAETITCPECQALNTPETEFCHECGYPFGFATLDPLVEIPRQRFFLSRWIEQPSKTGLGVMWLTHVPVVVISIAAAVKIFLERKGFEDFFFFWAMIGIGCGAIALLYRTTKNYIKRGKNSIAGKS